MSLHNLVVAYHGCDITVRDDLVAGRTRFRSSTNRYDWLGSGIYFYEADAQRALAHAQAVCEFPERLLAASPLATPAVVGVVLDVARWLDMSTRLGLAEFETAATTYLSGLKEGNIPVPANGPAFEGDQDTLHRPFDKAVFDLIHLLRARELAAATSLGDTQRMARLLPYQAVRSHFRQGKAISESSGFFSNNHVQVCLLDTSCIVGCFLPAGQRMQDEDARLQARQLLEQARSRVRALKPRKRAG